MNASGIKLQLAVVLSTVFMSHVGLSLFAMFLCDVVSVMPWLLLSRMGQGRSPEGYGQHLAIDLAWA
jgi:hypothetical protein